MKLSVVIPSFNSLHFLRKTIAALEKQDIPFSDFEVVIIDDASTDNTWEFLQNYPGPLNIKPLRNETNLGRARTRNRGIHASSGDLILFIDADIEPAADDFLRAHLEAQSPGPQISVGSFKYHPDFRKSGLHRYREKRGGMKFKNSANIPGRYFSTCNASVPKAVLLDEGGFDDRFVQYGGEDLELGHRLSKRLPIRSLPSAKGWHHYDRKLDDHLRLTETFGRTSLPLIFSLHPELKSQLSFDNIPPKTIRDYIIRIACAEPVFIFFKLLGKLAYMPPVVYNYLIFRSYRKGYLDSL